MILGGIPLKKVDRLPTIKNIKSENIHELALNIVNKLSFSETSDINDLADIYCAKYIEAYNHLVSKCYVQKTEEEKNAEKERESNRKTIDRFIHQLGTGK